MALSRWLRAARPAGGGLLIPGRPKRHACDLLLTADNVRVSAGDLCVLLPYEHYGAAGDDAWVLTWWDHGRMTPIGAAVNGTGCHTGGIAALHERRRTLWSRLCRLGLKDKDAPLCTNNELNLRVPTDMTVVGALCRSLALKPEWRPQLADPGLVAQLLSDLATKDRKAREYKMGVRGRTVDVRIAMRSIGLEHRDLGGRPLPDVAYPPEDELISAVMRRVVGNPFARPTDEATVREVLRRYYLDVPPWPFDALLPSSPHPERAPA